MPKYRIISLDVWGNAEDGWEVNAAYNTSHIVEIADESDAASVVDALIDYGYLSEKTRSAGIEWTGEDCIQVVSCDGMPLCDLRKD
jgi:hypothetical protein